MSTSIVVRDGTAYLSIDDAELVEKIDAATSFKAVGVEFTGRRGDGLTHLVRNSKAPVGLLERICRVIAAHGDTPQLSYADTQRAVKPRIPMRLYDVELRDYQQELEVAVALESRGIIRAPTGSGKTLMAAQIAVATGMHTVIIVPTIDLLRQTRQYLADHLATKGTGWSYEPPQLPGQSQTYAQWKIGQLGDGVVDPQPVTVATIRTMAKVLDVAYERYKFAEYNDADDTEIDRRVLRDWVESIGTAIFDECHQVAARVAYDTMAAIPAPNKYGMSASPWRDDGADLMIEAATGPCIFHVTCQRLVDAGYLMAPEIHVIDTSRWWTSAAWGQICKHCHRQWLTWTKECHCGCRTFQSQYDESYKKEIVNNPIYNLQIGLEAQKWYRPGFPVMVLVKQVGHGKQLAQVLENLGVVSTFLSGKDTGAHRQQVLDDLRADRVQAVVLTTIGDQGIDVPNLGALILGGGGKALALDTLLPTPGGWTTMGEVRAGDIVMDEQGQPTQVMRVHPIQYDRRCYRVRFSDGTSLVADGAHLWQTATHRSAGKVGIRTTDVIRDTLEAYKPGSWNHTIPVAGPLVCQHADLLLDPYLLGVWLGDGDGRMCVHTNKSEVDHFRAAFEARGWLVQVISESGTGAAAQSKQAIVIRVKALRASIRTLGLLIDKRRPQRTYVSKQIPAPYLRASIEQRLDLLRGLMDTDGHITKDGKAEWTTKSEVFADDMVELLRSLGYKPNVTAKHLMATGNVKKYGTKLVYGPYYTVRFYPTTDMVPVTLPHKVARVQPPKKRRRVNRQIVAVERVKSVPVRCIEVNSPSHLYLVGEGMVPTHNSSTRHLQRIGRTVRTAPGKPRPVVVEPDLSHIHSWYSRHIQKRSQIVEAEWGDLATWVQE